MQLVSLFFFFQAEDGIRDGHVTGVQTCALPIFKDLKDKASYSIGMNIGMNFKKQNVELNPDRSEEHMSELQSRGHLVCRLLLGKKKARYASVRPVPAFRSRVTTRLLRTASAVSC